MDTNNTQAFLNEPVIKQPTKSIKVSPILSESEHEAFKRMVLGNVNPGDRKALLAYPHTYKD